MAAAFRAGAQSYAVIGSPLYAALCAVGAEEPRVIELAASAMDGAQPAFHLLTAIQYLLLGDQGDPFARYFASMADVPLPPEDAGSDFLRFCRGREEDIRNTLASSTVQTTFVDRCAPLLAPLTWVADQIGEPMHLVEIGCSAGVLLTLDRYAYAFAGRGLLGGRDAPLTLTADIINPPAMRIPRIASRTGLDLNPLDPRSSDARRWLIAQIFPEFGAQRRQLQVALEEVVKCDIRLIRGDALQTLPAVLAETPDPLCLFHSVCLSYWREEARKALEGLLLAASAKRVFYRVGSEPSNRFSDWNKGRKAGGSNPGASGEITITRYGDGVQETRVVAGTRFGGAVDWRGWDG